MKRARQVLFCILILIFLPASGSLADLQRGDQGEEVTRLQTLLSETGFLFETPDGDFGKRTEQAVKEYQKFLGVETNGIATDELMDSLQQTWNKLFSSGQLDGESASGAVYPPLCNHWSTPEGNRGIDYCERHMAISAQADSLKSYNNTEGEREACELWRNEIDRLYGIWIDRTEERGKGTVAAAQTLFWTSMEAREAAIRGMYDAAAIEPGEIASVEYMMETLMREHAAWLCTLLFSVYGEYN